MNGNVVVDTSTQPVGLTTIVLGPATLSKSLTMVPAVHPAQRPWPGANSSSLGISNTVL